MAQELTLMAFFAAPLRALPQDAKLNVPADVAAASSGGDAASAGMHSGDLGRFVAHVPNVRFSPLNRRLSLCVCCSACAEALKTADRVTMPALRRFAFSAFYVYVCFRCT